MAEYFVVAYSFPAPLCGDQTTAYVEAPGIFSAVPKFVEKYRHPCGLYAARFYDSADAYHKGKKWVAEWLSPEARESRKPVVVDTARTEEPEA